MASPRCRSPLRERLSAVPGSQGGSGPWGSPSFKTSQMFPEPWRSGRGGLCRVGWCRHPAQPPHASSRFLSTPAPWARSQLPLQGTAAAKILSVTFLLVVASTLSEGQSNLSCSHFIMNIFSFVTYFQSPEEIQGVILSLEI